jgi:flagellar biosynthetic protein FlhB
MAEQDDASRTEEPTSKRLDDAKKRGQVALSQDAKLWAALTASAILVGYWLPGAVLDLGRSLLPFLEAPERFTVDVDVGRSGFLHVTAMIGLFVAPLLFTLLVIAVASSLGQSGLIFAPQRIKPEFSKISPLKGLQRLFALRALIDFIKGMLKVVIVGAIATSLCLPLLRSAEASLGWSLMQLLSQLGRNATQMLGGAAAAMFIVAIFDFVFQWQSHRKQLRMTKQEVRDEYKQSEGDPHIKARVRRLRMERSRRRMMASVPDATVVITNPTHFAVVLKYDMTTMPAPKVVAKGADFLAQRIRSVAEESDVPIIENPPLARSLYATVEVDDEIPPEHYQAVAQVIGHVMRLDRRQQQQGMAR